MIPIYFLQRTLFLSVFLNSTPPSSTFRDDLSLAASILAARYNLVQLYL